MLLSETTTDQQSRRLYTVKIFLFSLTLCLIFQNVIFCEARTSTTLRVSLPHGGTLIGRHMTALHGRHIRAFMGIPYAEPPLGNLRFERPVPYGSWSGEKLATAESPICLQRDPYRRDIRIVGSEDCLYLNVYTPEINDLRNLPVMVWFHGGGWQCGSGVRSFYGPEYLLEKDIVLVTANFRLGPLGFLSTETIDCPGNFGLKDQVEVLKWVQQNIASFGGNPKSVTLFGESAGGASVTYHMLSPKSKGLFHKAIAQSGTYFNPWAQPAYKGVPSERAKKLGDLVGCPYDDEDWYNMIRCLRKKSAKKIVETLYEMFKWDFDPMIPFPPVVEPQHPNAFLTKQIRNSPTPHGLSLPLMIGGTSDEGLLKTAALINLPDLLEDFKSRFYEVLPIILYYDHLPSFQRKIITEKLQLFYFLDPPNYSRRNHQNLTNLITDGWFLGGIDEYIRLRLKHKEVAETYVYLFEHKGAASFSEIFKGGKEVYYGACHADDLQYLFPVGRDLFKSSLPSENDRNLRLIMTALWVNFAIYGDPTPHESNLTTWLPIESYPVLYNQIGTKNERNSGLFGNSKKLDQKRLDVWKDITSDISSMTYGQKTEL